MRIGLVTDAWYPQINGVVTTLSHVRAELEARGHRMLVFNPMQFATVPCPRYPEIRLSCLPGRRLERMLDRAGLGALHIATEGPLGIAARRWARRRGLGFTTSYHTQFARYVNRYAGVPVDWGWKVLRWFHDAADRTLVPTESIRNELDGWGFEDLRVWTRGVNTSLFRPRDEAVFDEPRPIFLYAGRVAHEKNIEAFLDAKLPGTKIVVGDGPARPMLERRYPSVRFVGFKRGEALAAHYAGADVFVFPSLTDTFGIVLIEALACGVPVAAYPAPGPVDVLTGKTGVLDENLEHAARAALDLDPEDCRAHALTYSWSRCAEMFLDTLTRWH